MASGQQTQRSAPSLGAELTSHLWAPAMTSSSISCAKDKDVSDSRTRLKAPNLEMQAAQMRRCQSSQEPGQSASYLQWL